jgi:tetratricopeptide (TPR) repeat protein
MYFSRSLLAFVLIIFIAPNSWASKMQNMSLDDLLKTADRLCDDGNYPSCLEMLDFALEKKAQTKDQKISVYLSLSGNNGKAGNFQAEVDFAKKALAMDPNNFVGLSNLGVGLMGIQQIEESEKTFKKLSELDPTSPVAFYQMGVLQEQKRNDELALSHYLQAVKLNPTFVDAHYNLAMVYARKRDFSKAVEAMEIAKKNAPKDQDIAQMLNRLKADLKKKK